MTDAIHPQVRIVVQPYASALPLGFFAFGVGMFLLAAQGAGWQALAESRTTGLFLFAFVFPLEFLSAVVAFLARDTMAAAALGLFATSWLSTGLLLYTGEPGARSGAFGYYLVAFTIVTIELGVVAYLGKPLIGVILCVAAARSAVTAAYELGAGAGWERVGGWLALAIFVLSMYGGLAYLIEDALGRSVLPVWRSGASKEAIEGSLADQLQRLDSEAGVRQTL